MYKGKGRTVEIAIVKPDANIAVTDNRILVFPHVSDCQLGKPEGLVKRK
jgi:hypothetical protein